MSRDRLRVARIVLGFWLFGWYLNAPREYGFLDHLTESLDFPIYNAALGSLLSDSRLSLAAYLAPLASLLLFVRSDVRSWRVLSIAITACAAITSLHVQLCNDATFLTSFWVGLWLVWFCYHHDRDDAWLDSVGRGLAHGVVGLMFLGALVLKLTPEYESGAAFHGLYFQQEQSWPYPWLRSSYSRETVRELAFWFSRAAIFTETVLAASPLLPTRFVLPAFAGTALVMLFARNYHLFSVHSCLLGLLIGAFMLQRRGERAQHDARAAESS